MSKESREQTGWLIWLAFSLTLLIMVALPCPQANGQVGAKVRQERPRIFLTSEELDKWQMRFRQVQSLKSIYDATRRDLFARSSPHSNPYVSSMELQCFALFYLAEGRSKAPLERAKRWMDYFSAAEIGDHWSWPLITKALSIAYDWLYPDLTQDERKRYGEAIVRYADATLSYADHNAPPPNATWCNQVSDYYNQFYWHHGRIIFAGIALMWEKSFSQIAERYLHMSEEWLKNHMLPTTNQAGEDGGWFESLGYNQMTAAPFAELLEAWRTATGEDLFPQSKFLSGNCAWILHSLIPHTGKYVPLDDINPDAGPSTGQDAVGAFAPLLAVRYKDPYAQYFAQTLFPSKYAMMNFPYLLWYDQSVPVLDFAKAEKGRWFKGLGQVNMRTGWRKDDTFAIYRAGRVYGGHGHYSVGHFLIYRKGHLLVEDGYYGAKEPQAHNTLYIDGEMRKLPRSTPRHFFPKMDESPFDYGRILGYYHDEEFSRYDWIDSDITRAYTPKQAEKVMRRFVFLRPKTFIVIDYIRSPREVEKQFRLHAPAAPILDIERRLASWQEGDGKLFVQTMLPTNVNMQVSKRNVSHLLTISPKQPERETVFLHLLYAADLDEPMPSTRLHHADGFVGVQLDLAEITWIVWFRPDGEAAKGITYSITVNRPVRHLIADLSGDGFRIIGTKDETVPHPARKIVHFETTKGGKFAIEPLGEL